MNNSLYSSDEYSTALAIVGMAGRFPGASSLEQFWQNIANKVSSVRQYSHEELLAAGVKPEDLQRSDYVKAGTTLENIEYFDPSFFGFNPRDAELLDPQIRIFLECVWEALEMAGYDLTAFAGLIGVFAGAGYKNYLLHHIQQTPAIQATTSEFQVALTQETDVLATMTSYKLNLKGPSVSVQSFCSTSLVAVHLACQSLLNYECDIAVAGGVALNTLQMKGYFYEEGTIVSPDGICRPFDARTQGSVLSNGAAVVALKRLRDALKDGDQICSIIRGSAMNNDGNQRVGYTAPGLDGQASVIASALSYAGVHPETISYIEANGTGTRLGDAIELAALMKAFGGKTRKKGFCALGSLKPNVGHLDRASGVASLIKTTLALNHNQLPPHLYYEQPNPEVDLGPSPFYINTNLTPWLRQQTPRRAGINSFGLGGTNVHLVLEEAPERESKSPARPWQILPLSARSEWSLQQVRSNLIAHLKAYPDQSLADVAYTLQVGRSAFSYRQYVIAQTAEEACVKLAQQPAHAFHQEHRDRPVTFLFSDTGKHSIHMARNLYRQESHFRETIIKGCQFLQIHLKLDLQPLFSLEEKASDTPEITPDPLLAREHSSDWSCLKQAEVIQPAIFMLEYALARLLMEWNIRPQALLGYGPGEYVAACLAGVLSLEDALTIVVYRARLIAKQGELADTLPGLLHNIAWQEPQIPCLSGATGTVLTSEQATDPDYWVRRVCQPESFAEVAELPGQEPGRVLLEVGADCASERHSQIISLAVQRFDQADLLLAVGRLWLAGVTIDWPRLSAGEQRLRVALPTYPFERQRCWVDDPANLNVIRQRVAATKKETDVANWFYLPYWEPAVPPTLPRKTARQQVENLCLVFADSSGIGTRVVQRLEQEGCSVIVVAAGEAFAQQGDNHFSIRPDVGADYVALCKELDRKGYVPRTILHCWSVTAEEKIPAHLEHLNPQGARGLASLLCLVKAIGSFLYDAEIRLVVVSNHAQAVTGEEPLHPEKAPIIGACKVISQEYPSITCLSIDVTDLDAISWASTRLAGYLAAECLIASPDLVVAYRGYTRWTQKYLPMRLEQAEKTLAPFRTRGVYLIIGGLGEVGLILAESLATKVQARIAVVDESFFPSGDQWFTWLESHPQDDPVSQKIQRLQALEALGAQIWVLQADLTDAVQMKQVVEQIYHRFGTLHGVLHLAGSSDLQAIQDLNQADYEAHFRPKLHSLSALEQALRGASLDFCFLFSSLTGVLGGLGCMTDAAISAFTDAFVFKQNQTSTSLWMSVNWDPWHTRENEQRFTGTTLARFMLSPNEGVDALSRIIASQWPRMITSTGNLYNRIQQWMQAGSEGAFQHKPACLDTLRPAVSAAYVPPESPIEQKIVEVWQLLLGFERIGIYDNFFELHGHSLLGMQLIARLRQLFQINIPLTKLFEGPTVAELAQAVEALFIEEIESLGEEEARMLI
jgi:acyl transferase domain-containing protein/acyl carrier protein